MLYLYAQGSKSIGMGHLFRTIRLAELCVQENVAHALILDLDVYAEDWISQRDIEYLTINAFDGVELEAVVIDAISIGSHLERLFRSARQRVVISPVFNAFHIATHVLVRELSKAVRLALKPSVELIEDESFAFSTAEVKQNRELEYSSLNVGVCLSGGKQSFPFAIFFEYLEAIPGLESVTLVGEDESCHANFSVDVIPFQESSAALWDKLAHVNVFIGRQGLMVAEALAQSIPVISLRDGQEVQKNMAFIEQGIMKSCEISSIGLEEMAEFLSQKKNIQSVNDRLRGYLRNKDSNSLFSALIKVLK